MESRLLDYIQLLAEHPLGLHVSTLEQRLGVCRDRVYKLREKAQTLGVWILTNKEDSQIKRGWFRLENPDEVKRNLNLAQPELESLRAAIARINNLTPLAGQAAARLLGQRWSMAPEPLIYSPLIDEYPKGVFERVARAIRERRTCKITYKNALNALKSYLFDPYALIARDPHIYLVGANHNSRAGGFDPIQELRLDQVQALALVRERFTRPNFDVREYCQRRFRVFGSEGQPVRVRVQFAPEKAGFIRRTRRHSTQVVENLADGGVVWQVEVPISEDLLHFIAGYGPYAKVLEPQELKVMVMDWAKGVLANADRP